MKKYPEMKSIRIISLLLAALMSFQSFAGDISPETARCAAENFLRRSGIISTKSANPLVLLNADGTSLAKSSSRVPYYIFSMVDEAFVIISAVDAAKPVLGYSLENGFRMDEDMPDNVKAWLSMYGTQIELWRSSGIEASAEQKAEWTEILYPDMIAALSSAKDLQTPDWGQTAPCNNYCPVDASGRHTITGCVATAVSELMYYYKFPEKGKGTLPAYVTENGMDVQSVDLGDKYAWNDMLPEYQEGKYTEIQADAVAKLMYHNAVMCQADFGAVSTGAVISKAVAGMLTHMGYSKLSVQCSKDYMTDEKWKSMLKTELDASRPVLYAAQNSISGGYHAFLVDGYDNQERFLINFGWFGMDNGYYELGAFGTYSLDETAYIGLYPDTEGSTDYRTDMTMRVDAANGLNGLTITEGRIEQGETVYIRAGMLLNNGFNDFEGDFNLALTGSDGCVKAWLLDKSASLECKSQEGAFFVRLGFKMPSDIAICPGDAIRAFYRGQDDSEWTQFGYGENPDNPINEFIPCYISDFTSLSYDALSKSFSIKTYPGVHYEIRSSAGKVADSGTVDASGIFKVSLFPLESGDWYDMDMKYGSQELSVRLK